MGIETSRDKFRKAEEAQRESGERPRRATISAHSFRAIADLASGDHLCCLYETEEEHRAVLTPFMRQGLERGEKLLYIVDARSAETVLSYLRDDGLSVEPYMDRGQLTVLTADDAYMRQGVFDPDGMIAMLRTETERALAEGYTALRVTGEMSWALRGLPGSERLIEYESKLNDFFPGSDCLAICQYDRRSFEPSLLLDVLATHPVAVVGTEVYDNFYYMPPKDFLGNDPPAARLRDWVENLAERKRADEALRQRTRDLGERVKELNCLYGISRLIQEPGTTLEEVLQGTVELIPPSWQYPEITCARIILDGREFKTANFEQSAWKQACEITVNGCAMGTVEVCYLDQRPEADEGPFLKEERHLVNAIAEQLGRITDLRRAEDEIREQGEFLQRALDSLRHPFYVVDAQDYTIKTANAAASLDPLPANATCYELTHGSNKPCGDPDHPCPLAEVIRTRVPFTAEHVHYDKHGRAKVLEVHCYPILDSSGKVTQVIEYSLDISERRRAQDALEASERDLTIQNKIGNVFLTAPDDEMYGDVLGVVLEALESKHGVFGYVDEDGSLVYPSMTRDVWSDCRIPDKSIVFPREAWGGIWGQALTEKKTLYSNEPFRVPEGHIPMRRAIDVPITHQGRVIGNLMVANKATDYDDRDRRLLELIADRIAPILDARLQRDRGERERRGAEEALRASEEQYRFLAEHAGDVIWLSRFLPEPHYEYASPSAEAVTGYAPEEYYADPGLRLRIVHPEDRPLYEEFVRSPKSFEGRPLLLRRVRKDGTAIWTEQHNSLVLDEAGDPVANIAVVRDITERVRSEAELERLRSEFLGMVTHELRTPLTAIKGSAATALGSRRPLNNTEHRELLEIIDEQADRLRSLTDDILDMTRIEAGTLPVSPEPVDLHEIIEEARKIFVHSGGSQALDVRTPDALPKVRADRQRTVQVITNLIGNAARYSPDTALIELLVEHDAVQVTVHVRDHGRGIPKDKLPHLFKKFSQLRQEDAPRSEGVGLGLAISKGIIESQGGRIWAESAGAGQGATFSFTLPVAEDMVASEETASATGAGMRRRGEKARVLAVDDEPQALRFIRRALEEAGHEVLATGDPTEVAKLVELEEPDVVLLDLRLPGTSGFELLRRIREFSGVPVIFLTASDRDEDLVRALQMGADDYITKPFSPSELLARLEVALRRRAATGREEVRPPFVLGDLTVDFTERRVVVENRPVTLSATEYKLLVELAAHAGRVLTHDQILQRVWGADYSGETELVRAFIRNLRRKLGDDARHPRFIFTEPQVGYRMPRPR